MDQIFLRHYPTRPFVRIDHKKLRRQNIIFRKICFNIFYENWPNQNSIKAIYKTDLHYSQNEIMSYGIRIIYDIL